jgi:hypothetical protein
MFGRRHGHQGYCPCLPQVKKDTVLRWLRRAGQHSAQVPDYLMRNLQVEQARLDELWTFVLKKEKALSAWEKLHSEYGDNWMDGR